MENSTHSNNEIIPPIKYCKKCGTKMLSKQITSDKFDSITGKSYPLFAYNCPNLKGLSKLFVGIHDRFKLYLENNEWVYSFYLSDCDF